MSKLVSHPHVRATLPVFAILPLLANAVGAQVITGFETSNGYTLGSSIVGVDDSGIPGSAAWAAKAGFAGPAPIISSANPQSGSSAIRIVRDASAGASAIGTHVDLSAAGVAFSGAGTQPIALSFSVAIGSGYSAGTGNQFQVYLGSSTINPTGDAYWTSIVFNEGSFQLWRSPGSGNNTAFNLGSYTTYAPLGQYVTFNLVFDPVAKTYQSLSISGSSGAADLTSSVSGMILPWRPGLATDPAKFLSLVVGGNDLVTVDFDNLSISNISNIPEPAHASAIFGAAIAAFALGRRRRSVR